MQVTYFFNGPVSYNLNAEKLLNVQKFSLKLKTLHDPNNEPF